MLMTILIIVTIISVILILIKTGILNMDKLRENMDKIKIKAQEPSETSRYRYPSLRIIAGIISIFAAIVMLASVGIAIYFFSEGREMDIIFGVISIVFGLLNVLILTAVAESIKVIIDIEYNTRKTADAVPQPREREPVRREPPKSEPARKPAISVDDI